MKTHFRPLPLAFVLGSLLAATSPARAQTLVVNPTNPGISGETWVGPSYTVPNTTSTYANVYDGYNGSGSITQSTGTLNDSGSLIVAFYPGSNGSSYTLGGTGQLGVAFLDVGYSATGTFTQTAGMDTVSGALLVGEGTGGNAAPTRSAGRARSPRRPRPSAMWPPARSRKTAAPTPSTAT